MSLDFTDDQSTLVQLMAPGYRQTGGYIIMMVADALVPNRCQDIRTHNADLIMVILYDTGIMLQPISNVQGRSGGWQPGPRFNIKTLFPRYRDSHVKDKTVPRPSYL